MRVVYRKVKRYGKGLVWETDRKLNKPRHGFEWFMGLDRDTIHGWIGQLIQEYDAGVVHKWGAFIE